MGATKIALEQATSNCPTKSARARGFIGVGLGGLENLERVTLILDRKGPSKVSLI